MHRVNRAKYEAKRRKILAAAAERFATKGFATLEHPTSCAAAGISSGNLFHYFASKRAIHRDL
jgi:AcrR family transcriptional regulator